MTEKPREPLDHLDPPAPDPEATQPLPPPPPRQHPVHRPPVALIAFLAAGVVIAGAVLAILLGRIGPDPAPASGSPPRRFLSPQALVDYLDRRGLGCDGFQAVDDARNAVGRGRCVAAGQPVAVGVYEGHSDVEAQWVAMAGSREPLFMALGENWAVDGPAGWTRRVAEVMNVQYRAQP
ncbi:hypothetical protein ABT297_29250 [Dactylosporangium sp. NPDC000555]|uniref:hypothetical protein n=1 Tax=Dactylosporangium sp. NPDC000555 TaxID=3154260 RepID=UPI003322CA7F